MTINNTLNLSLRKSELCKAACLMNKDVLLTAILNKNGRVIESEINYSENLNGFTTHELEIIAMQRSLQTSVLKEFDDKLSAFNHTITMRETYVEFLYLLPDGLLFVIAKADGNVPQLSTDLSFLKSEFQLYLSDAIVI